MPPGGPPGGPPRCAEAIATESSIAVTQASNRIVRTNVTPFPCLSQKSYKKLPGPDSGTDVFLSLRPEPEGSIL